MAAETARIGVIGLGTIGRHHTDRLSSSPHTVVGGMDISADARSAYYDNYNGRIPVFDSLDDLLAEDLDGVIVTTPNAAHEQCTVPALDAGVSVLCEKPLAHTVESAERIAQAARDSAGFCMVGFSNRFHHGIEILRSRIQSGDFGRPMHINASYMRRRGVPGRGTWFTREDAAGGGALIDIGVHALDLSMYLLDFPDVDDVSATVRSEFGTRDDYTYLGMWGSDQGNAHFSVEDSVRAFIRCETGQSITLSASWASNRPAEQELVVDGTRSGAVFDFADEELTFHDVKEDGVPYFDDSHITTDDYDILRRELDYFTECLVTDTDPTRNTVEQGVMIQRLMDAMYESSAHGEPVSIDTITSSSLSTDDGDGSTNPTSG